MTKMFFDMWARWDALVHCKWLWCKVHGKLLKPFISKGGDEIVVQHNIHPQMDGHIERVNGVLNQYLKNYTGVN
jgi:hypothetical protein